MNDRFAVIMAGGSGTRFWPRSRRSFPKQLLRVEADRTLVQSAVARLLPVVPRERILVVTRRDQAEALAAQVDLPAENILSEPAGRNTAPCIGLAALVIEQRCPGAVMAVTSADHVIEQQEEFSACLTRALDAARDLSGLVALGVRPKFPATGYGYVELGEEVRAGVHAVAAFHEKPVRAIAEEYVESGRFVWNTGIFAWRAAVVLEEIRDHLPELAAGLDRLAGDEASLDARLDEVYGGLPAESIDQGVMERSRRRHCVPATFEWDDVGSFAALARHNPADADGNVRLGDVVTVDAGDCIADAGEGGVVALLGVEDLIVIRTGDAVLVAARDQAERVKDVVARLEAEGLDRYL